MIRITVSGISLVSQRMRSTHRSLTVGMPSAHKKAAIVLYQWIQDNFASEGGKVGGWAPLSRRRLRERRAFAGGSRNFSPKILTDTGALRTRWTVIGTQLKGEVRSRISYGRDHQEGVPSRKLPQRRILPTDDEAAELVFPIFRRMVRTSVL